MTGIIKTFHLEGSIFTLEVREGKNAYLTFLVNMLTDESIPLDASVEKTIDDALKYALQTLQKLTKAVSLLLDDDPGPRMRQ